MRLDRVVLPGVLHQTFRELEENKKSPNTIIKRAYQTCTTTKSTTRERSQRHQRVQKQAPLPAAVDQPSGFIPNRRQSFGYRLAR